MFHLDIGAGSLESTTEEELTLHSIDLTIKGNVKFWFSTHLDHVSVSPTDGIGPTQGQRKTLTRVGMNPRPSGLITTASPTEFSRKLALG